MASQLLHRGGRGRWTSRTTALVCIVAGHVGLFALALLVRGPRADVDDAEAISVSLLTEEKPEQPAPQLQPRLPEVELPDVVVPPVLVDIPQEAPAAITVVAKVVPPAPPAPPAAAVARDTSEPIVATSVEYLRPPAAMYPAAAKQARVSGTVYVRALVETDGHVRDVSVHRSSGHAVLDKAASESVLAALFRPYMRDGVARAALVIVPIDFTLKVRGGRPDKGVRHDDGCGPPHGPDRGDHDHDHDQGNERPDDRCHPDRAEPLRADAGP